MTLPFSFIQGLYWYNRLFTVESTLGLKTGLGSIPVLCISIFVSLGKSVSLSQPHFFFPSIKLLCSVFSGLSSDIRRHFEQGCVV